MNVIAGGGLASFPQAYYQKRDWFHNSDKAGLTLPRGGQNTKVRTGNTAYGVSGHFLPKYGLWCFEEVRNCLQIKALPYSRRWADFQQDQINGEDTSCLAAAGRGVGVVRGSQVLSDARMTATLLDRLTPH